MKNLKKIATARLLAAILLLAVCMAGCAAPAEPNSGVPSKTDAPAESDSSGAPADAPQALTLPILDEIDAALDEGNVRRYAQYLQNFTDTTQFILVTHRRSAMEEASVLYGVTMQEDGVSKLLKLDLEHVDATLVS